MVHHPLRVANLRRYVLSGVAPLYHCRPGLSLALHVVPLGLWDALSVRILAFEQLMLVMDITSDRLLTAIFCIAVQQTRLALVDVALVQLRLLLSAKPRVVLCLG